MFATFGGPYDGTVVEVLPGETRVTLRQPVGQVAAYQLAGNRLLWLGTADGPADECDGPIVVGGPS